MIQLGDKVKDKVSGFTGIVISRIEYLNGCIQFCVKPSVDKSGKDVDGIYIDEEQLKIVGAGLNVVRKKTGGPSSDAPSERYGNS